MYKLAPKVLFVLGLTVSSLSHAQTNDEIFGFDAEPTAAPTAAPTATPKGPTTWGDWDKKFTDLIPSFLNEEKLIITIKTSAAPKLTDAEWAEREKIATEQKKVTTWDDQDEDSDNEDDYADEDDYGDEAGNEKEATAELPIDDPNKITPAKIKKHIDRSGKILNLAVQICREEKVTPPANQSDPSFAAPTPYYTEKCKKFTKIKGILNDTAVEASLNVNKVSFFSSGEAYLKITASHPIFFGIGKKKVAVHKIDFRNPSELLLEKQKTSEFYDQISGRNLEVTMRMEHKDLTLKTDLDYQTALKNFDPIVSMDLISKRKDLLKGEQTIGDILWMDSGVGEGYSLREHNFRVMQRLGDNYHCWVDKELEAKLADKIQLPLRAFMSQTMIFHDIGKPIAYKAGEKYKQHEYTTQITRDVYPLIFQSPFARSLSTNLIDHDAIGEYVQRHIPLDEAVKIIKNQAALSNMEYADFFRLQMLYFTADAGSYPGVASSAFYEEEKSKCQLMKSERYQILENVFLPKKTEKRQPIDSTESMN